MTPLLQQQKYTFTRCCMYIKGADSVLGASWYSNAHWVLKPLALMNTVLLIKTRDFANKLGILQGLLNVPAREVILFTMATPLTTKVLQRVKGRVDLGVVALSRSCRAY